MCSHSSHDGLDQFNPREYLYTYYQEVDEENEELLSFWDSLPLDGRPNILEIGSGPTIFTAIPLAWRANYMSLSDSLPENLKEIELWRTYHPMAFNWMTTIRHYYNSTRHEQMRKAYKSPKEFANALRSHISTFQFDLHKDALDKQYDAIVTSFCLAEACTCQEELYAMIIELSKSLTSNGTFGMVTATYSDHYSIGKDTLPMASVDNSLTLLFVQLFKQVGIKTIPICQERGYKEILCIWGWKPKREP